MLETYSFIEDEVNIDKYIKMMRCGVPPPAIKNKMALEKIDPSLLDKFLPQTTIINVSEKTIKQPKLNIKKKELKPIKVDDNSGFRMTLDVLKNIKLKKTTIKKSTHPFTHMNPFINVDELQEIKRKILNE